MTQSLPRPRRRELGTPADWLVVARVATLPPLDAARARATTGGDQVTLDRGPGHYAALVRVEAAVGVLMELCGWEATKARSRLVSAAVSVNAPVEAVAEALLALGPEAPRR